jgi:hypothetical protein
MSRSSCSLAMASAASSWRMVSSGILPSGTAGRPRRPPGPRACWRRESAPAPLAAIGAGTISPAPAASMAMLLPQWDTRTECRLRGCRSCRRLGSGFIAHGASPVGASDSSGGGAGNIEGLGSLPGHLGAEEGPARLALRLRRPERVQAPALRRGRGGGIEGKGRADGGLGRHAGRLAGAISGAASGASGPAASAWPCMMRSTSRRRFPDPWPPAWAGAWPRRVRSGPRARPRRDRPPPGPSPAPGGGRVFAFSISRILAGENGASELSDQPRYQSSAATFEAPCRRAVSARASSVLIST